ncbi:anti-sigma factor [Chloroflexus sp.]|uniref:anti-sigma factor n=1 Tax=Chloroflexus sp. TaxID=1904827 RepID=UPI002ACEF5ED|nr:anti-sigma factor [Chloroflexus sp.]
MIEANLAHWLAQTGDTLYSIALAFAPDERVAQRLLRQWVADLSQHPPASWQSDELVARLYRVAVANDPHRPLERRPAPAAAPVLGPLRAMPLPQRMAVLAYSVLGMDSVRLAKMIGQEPADAIRTLEQAVQALAPASRHSLPAQVSSDECVPVRQALIDPAQHLRAFEQVRRHLAGCAHCRMFEREWQAATRELALILRRYAQTFPMPAKLADRLLRAAATPRQRLATFALAAPAAALVVLVAILILPGMFRNPVTVVATGANEPVVQADDLVARALAHGGIPEPEGPPVWQARYQTLWYFNNRTVAPLYAEIWHDRDNPARHRLQLRHVDGGAPYEFQLGDGERRLYYALDGAYAPVLYGDLPVPALPNEPALVASAADPSQQQAAFTARRASGPWHIPPNYLHQAAEATDLRLLGRQRIGDRLAYIVSFRGISPLDVPADAAEPVTVLMAIGETDGHVLNITELIGPPGGTQTSRVVWRLVEFTWLVTGEQIRDAFIFERAWNGRAEASGVVGQPLVNPEWPLVRLGNVIEPSAIGRVADSLILPATIPDGIERAVLLRWRGPRINGAIYTGAGKQLMLTFDRLPGIDSAIPTEVIGPWRVRIEPVRGQRYRVAIEMNTNRRGSNVRLSLEATGFTLDEVRAIIESLRPLNSIDVRAQETFFMTRR